MQVSSTFLTLEVAESLEGKTFFSSCGSVCGGTGDRLFYESQLTGRGRKERRIPQAKGKKGREEGREVRMKKTQ